VNKLSGRYSTGRYGTWIGTGTSTVHTEVRYLLTMATSNGKTRGSSNHKSRVLDPDPEPDPILQPIRKKM
jgi:hypothetical protein